MSSSPIRTARVVTPRPGSVRAWSEGVVVWLASLFCRCMAIAYTIPATPRRFSCQRDARPHPRLPPSRRPSRKLALIQPGGAEPGCGPGRTPLRSTPTYGGGEAGDGQDLGTLANGVSADREAHRLHLLRQAGGRP